jgi:hypothetical protein
MYVQTNLSWWHKNSKKENEFLIQFCCLWYWKSMRLFDVNCDCGWTDDWRRFISRFSNEFDDDWLEFVVDVFDSVSCRNVCVNISRLFSKPVDCECWISKSVIRFTSIFDVSYEIMFHWIKKRFFYQKEIYLWWYFIFTIDLKWRGSHIFMRSFISITWIWMSTIITWIGTCWSYNYLKKKI